MWRRRCAALSWSHPSAHPPPADRRPIDPPPIIQLRVIDAHTRQPPSPANPDADDTDPNYANNFLQNPYYFMFASLAKPDDDTELHWLKVRILPSCRLIFHPSGHRMEKHDALPAQLSPPYTILKTPRTVMRTLVSLSSQILAYAQKVATVSSSVSLKSSGTFLLSLVLSMPHTPP